ncbi:hypothetical protein D8X55_02890 [Malacoplasma penetrans]|nr:hypothetical protein D8X55_02890 [Malacoplasma penetrans]
MVFNMNKKSKKIILSTTSSVLSIATALSIALPITNNAIKNYSITNVSSTNQVTTESKIIPSEVNDQNANISTNNGPVTFLGNKITALDWFGNELWSIDFSQKVPDKDGATPGNNYDGAWKRAWFNWDYNRSTDTIWVLGSWSVKNNKQPLFEIKAADGTITKTHEINYAEFTSSLGQANNSNVYRFVSALSSGKVMVYGGAGTTYNGKAILYDPKTLKGTVLNGNSSDDKILPLKNTSYGSDYKWYFFNLIPVATNRNIVEVVTFANKETSGDAGNGLANYNVYFLLVDDELNMVYNQNTNNPWSKHVLVANGISGYRNSKVTPQRDYYSLLDGRVVTVVYNTAIIIDAKNSNDIKYGTYPVSESKWIKSWAFDSNQNLYFKFKDESNIYKVSGSVWQTINNNTTSIPLYVYLDLKGIGSTSAYANDLIMYNVYGYTGQLMMINSKYNSLVNTSNSNITTDNNPQNYGLALAVTQNANLQDKGDYKGILNGPDTFQKASDFELSSSALSSKIPSEITKDDIETSNGGFMKDSTDFTIKSMDDKTGSIQIECKLYQIPWFTTSLPEGITPKIITKQYTTTKKIADKTSWKTLTTSTDYDFLNMKPSKITEEDVTNLDPFQVSFQSQTIVDSTGKILYPKKTYSVGTKNDSNGQVEVKIKYEYIPMEITYSNDTKATTYDASHTYTVFNSSTTPAFKFMGQNGSSSSIDISKVSELKNLLSADTLPSSFLSLNSSSDKTNSAFLQFINTNESKGYPISKMKFTVTANDNSGSLTIKADMPASYSPENTAKSFSVTYTGLNRASNYSFSFKDVTKIGTQNINAILPSAVTDGDIINNFLQYNGFNSNDFSIVKTVNDETGELTVAINLDKTYATAIGNSGHGFNNYTATKVFTGFMTKDEYNKRFDVQFLSDTDNKLIQLKQMQAAKIYESFKGTSPTSLQVGNQTYSDLKDLIKKLLVQSSGTSIPADWSDSSITADMYIDNAQGTISFYVKIPQDKITGSNSDINLVVNYTGFVKGNIDNTSDNLSFIADNMLKSYLISNGDTTEEDFNKFTPDTFAKWLEDSNYQKALKLISYKSGQYEDLLNTSKYKISVIANETQRTVSVFILFSDVTDPKSLKEYSVTYTI